MSAQPLDIRMAHLEGAYEQINERLGSMEVRFDARFDALDRKIEAKTDGESVERRFDAIDKKFTTVFIAIWSNTALVIAAIIGAAFTLQR
jgi:hypothetical protein